MKLTPAQIRRLSEHIKASLEANPKDHSDCDPETEAWEIALAEAVDLDNGLPMYSNLEDDTANCILLEALIMYYDPVTAP